MKAMILDGDRRDGRSAACRLAKAALSGELKTRGWTIQDFRLADMKIKPCRGCFACWIKTPGICVIDDDETAIHRALASSHLRVFLTPVTFGGFSSLLKAAMDRSIPSLLPFFHKVNDEMHHPPRYDVVFDTLMIGVLRQPDPEAEGVFRLIVERNAINMLPRRHAVVIIYDGDDEAVVAAKILEALPGEASR